jgi:transcription elongation factor Elf1
MNKQKQNQVKFNCPVCGKEMFYMGQTFNGNIYVCKQPHSNFEKLIHLCGLWPRYFEIIYGD